MSDYVTLHCYPLNREQINRILMWRPVAYRRDPFEVEADNEVEVFFANGVSAVLTVQPDGRLEVSLVVEGEDPFPSLLPGQEPF